MPGSVYHRYPDYISYQKRLDSFVECKLHDRVKPEDLASAGLFYGGRYDGVMCFSCGMEMRSIKAEDDPWILHVKYSSKCTFVTQEKDPAFINAHAVDYSKLPRREEEDFGLITPCKMCNSRNINTVFVPCSHYVTCERCAQKENHCLECNAPILERVRAYTS